jgi:signal transduction histidine kinase
MKKRTGFPGKVNYGVLSVLLIGFGTLSALIVLLWFSAARKAEQIYRDASVREETYRQLSSALYSIQNNIFFSGIVLRDYLLDEPPPQRNYRLEAERIKSSIVGSLDQLDLLLGSEDRDLLAHLRQQVDQFWKLRESAFDWTPEQKKVFALSFIERNASPQRDAILSITREMTRLRASRFEQEQVITARRWAEFGTFLSGLFSIALLLAGVIAGVSIFRLLRLERQSEKAEEGLRRLSQQLVQTQEDERKAISRELHDEIGQMATALRLELGNLGNLGHSPGGEYQSHLLTCKGLAENLLQSVRNLARGLRPAMLDHLGLGPALQSQAREFSARTRIPATVQLDPDLPDLPEPLRICIYRIVQESLTNCARHAKASKVRILVRQTENEISVAVQDDGAGFDPAAGNNTGLGLIGMQERAMNLGGTMTVSSRLQSGTQLEIRLPLMPPCHAGESANVHPQAWRPHSAEADAQSEKSNGTVLPRL